jgi:NAD(P)-dependent dehydrogenase (short-subunit alcohol dehydrogenase family)
VGARAAGLLAKAGADVVLTSRKPEQNARVVEELQKRFGNSVHAVKMSDASQAAAVLEGAHLVLNAGGAGIVLVPRDAWAGRAGLRAIADLNAVPPLGVEGIEANDDGVEREVSPHSAPWASAS